ncbi:acetyltransferase [Amylibacter sp.]|jgi:sugar O-acyltransferase (sialic acid O-acetyltransferase NeuD family)|nr:acetyltransferase [Amylibacter sp.]
MKNERQKLLIFGIGVTAKSIYAYFQNDRRYLIEGFVIDKEYRSENTCLDLPVHEYEKITKDVKRTHKFIVCIGYQKLNKSRAAIIERLKSDDYKLTSLVANSVDTLNLEYGENCVFMPGHNIQPFCKFGEGVFVWPGAVVGHDTVVSDHCWITAGASIGGNCKIGSSTFVGLGAKVADSVTVGSLNLIGAGSYVSKCTKDNQVFISEGVKPAPMGADSFVRFSKFGQ